MSYLITQAELEHLSETELRRKYHAIISELAIFSLADCPLAKATLQNILQVLVRKQRLKPLAPRF